MCYDMCSRLVPHADFNVALRNEAPRWNVTDVQEFNFFSTATVPNMKKLLQVRLGSWGAQSVALAVALAAPVLVFAAGLHCLDREAASSPVH